MEMNDAEMDSLLEWIKKQANRADRWKFKQRSIGNHLNFIQNFHGIEVAIGYSFEGAEQQPNLFHITLLFWTIEITW